MGFLLFMTYHRDSLSSLVVSVMSVFQLETHNQNTDYKMFAQVLPDKSWDLRIKVAVYTLSVCMDG